MTVAELIEVLKTCPPEAKVYDCVANEVTRVRVFRPKSGSTTLFETHVALD